MIPSLPPELKEAVKLLEIFEKSDDHTIRTRSFEDAIEILDDCEEDKTFSLHQSFIINLKRSYSRKLLEMLPQLHFIDVADWFKYILLLLIVVPEETEQLTQQNKLLKKNVREFLKVWAKESLEILEKFNE